MGCGSSTEPEKEKPNVDMGGFHSVTEARKDSMNNPEDGVDGVVVKPLKVRKSSFKPGSDQNPNAKTERDNIIENKTVMPVGAHEINAAGNEE